MQIFFPGNFIHNWKAPPNQTARLFKQKYSDVWERFCLQNRLARQTRTGLLVHEDVANLYMTLLAQVIADGLGVSPITDDPLLDRFGMLTRSPEAADSATIETARAVINLELPGNLSNISLDEVIRQRNSSGFKKRLRGFHHELNAFMSNTEQGKKLGNFETSLGSAWTDFREDILKLGLGVTGFSLGVWIAVGAGPIGTLKGVQQIAGGLSLAVTSGIAIRNTWNHTETKRFTRKYLADLRKMRLDRQ